MESSCPRNRHVDEGEYERSLNDLDGVTQFDPQNALALYARGLTPIKKGDDEAGKAEINAVKTMDPNVAGQFVQSDSPAQ